MALFYIFFDDNMDDTVLTGDDVDRHIFGEDNEITDTETVTTSDGADLTADDTDTVEASVEESADLVTKNNHETHDPFATLSEQPQPVKDAANISSKWNRLSSDEQAEKVLKLYNSGRTETLEALAKSQGKTSDELVTEFLSNEDTTETEAKPSEDELYEKFKERMLKEVDAKNQPLMQHAEMLEFKTQVDKFAQHNNLTKESSEKLKQLDGEVFKMFKSVSFDPATGQKMTLNQKLKYALSNSESVKSELINAKANKKAGEIAKGLDMQTLNLSAGGKDNEDEFEKLFNAENPNLSSDW